MRRQHGDLRQFVQDLVRRMAHLLAFAALLAAGAALATRAPAGVTLLTDSTGTEETGGTSTAEPEPAVPTEPAPYRAEPSGSDRAGRADGARLHRGGARAKDSAGLAVAPQREPPSVGSCAYSSRSPAPQGRGRSCPSAEARACGNVGPNQAETTAGRSADGGRSRGRAPGCPGDDLAAQGAARSDSARRATLADFAAELARSSAE